MKNVLRTVALLGLMAFLGNEKAFTQRAKELDLTSKKGLKEFNEKFGKNVGKDFSGYYEPDSTVYQLTNGYLNISAHYVRDTFYLVQQTSRDYYVAPLHRLHVEEIYATGPDKKGDGNLLAKSKTGNRHFEARVFYEPSNGYAKRELVANDFPLFRIDYEKRDGKEMTTVKMEGSVIQKDSSQAAFQVYKNAVEVTLVDGLTEWRKRTANFNKDMETAVSVDNDKKRMLTVLQKIRVQHPAQIAPPPLHVVNAP